MNLKTVIRILGVLLLMVSLSMALSFAIAAYEYYQLPTQETWAAFAAFVCAIGTGVALCLLFLLLSRGASGRIEIREALLLVTLSWLWGGFLGAIPFYIWALLMPSGIQSDLEFISIVNCFFESVSGLTATGASILKNIERLPMPILFWRANIQWLGGLGIVVLFVAVLPWIASGSQKIFKAESTGIGGDTGTANINEMARLLWVIYLCLTVAQVVLLMLGDSDLGVLTAITFAFSTTATAGLSVYNSSVGELTVFNQWVCVLFMLFSGVNFGLYYGLIKGRFAAMWQDLEFRSYIGIVAIATILVGIGLYGHEFKDMRGHQAENGVWGSVHYGLFQVVSIFSTTGFSNANSGEFPVFAKVILITLMMIGGCGGSTSGGIKVIRIISAVRLMLHDIEKVYRPQVVRPLVVGNKIVEPSVRQGVLIYVLLALCIVLLSTFILSVFEWGNDYDLISLATASLACLNNVGPGFNLVGVTENYFFFRDGSKLFLAAIMIIGRLEIFTVLALLLPRFWRH